jgi:Tfp pilus assembly protein PilF
MPSPRETMFLQMVKEYPDAAMGHFSLGKLYLEEGRFAEAVPSLENAVKLDPKYAAALVALGDAHAGAKNTQLAAETYRRALSSPHAQKDTSLQAEIAQKLSSLQTA